MMEKSMTIQFCVSLVVCLIGFTIRTSYEVLKKSGKLDPWNKGVFAIVFAGMGMMLSSWFFMGMADPWQVLLPAEVRWAGIALIAGGLIIAFAGLFQLKGLENIDHLVTVGIYARIRHPMYIGFILFILGWVTYFGALATLIVGVVAIINILYWRHLEELNYYRLKAIGLKGE